MSESLVSVENVSIGFPDGDRINPVTHKVTFNIGKGEVFALVGESGSGKTIISKSLMQLLPETAHILEGNIRFQGAEVYGLAKGDLLQHRGGAVGMVFQEPLTSLNPALTVGAQLSEGLKLHTDMSDDAIREACVKMLERVKLRDPERAMKQYPHEFSGGMRQRIMLASVMLLQPSLLIADEPTTALDVMIQKEVLDIMVGIVREEGTSMLLVTHDLALVSEYADRIAVMEKGVLVETGDARGILENPTQNYTKRLIAAVPGKARKATKEEDEIGGTALVEAFGMHVTFSNNPLLWWKKETLNAVKGASISIKAGETVALVGESGSGKSTLGRALLGLTELQNGNVFFDGHELSNTMGGRTAEERKKMQLVFQDPFSSLNPRMKIQTLLLESLRHDKSMPKAAKQKLVIETLEQVGLSADFATRLPHELSGGQRQRVCIARAMISDPSFVVADEPVSALDVTVQAQVLKLLKDLQNQRGFAHLFISHDLAVVEEIADRVMVMYHGHIVEEGDVDQIFDNPHHPYTIALLNAAPRFHTDERQAKTLPKWPVGYEPLSMESIKVNTATIEHAELIEVSEGHRVSAQRIPN